MVVQQQYISADAFWELIQSPEYEERLVELVEGVMIEMPKPGGKPGVVTFEISLHIGNFVKQNKLGWVTAAETGYVLYKNPEGRDTVRGLDIGFVASDRAPQGLPEGLIPFAPDLAVEVISPGNTASDIHSKILELLHAGTRLIWIIYPDSKTVAVHTTSGAKTFYADDTLDGGDVLPGFTLSIKAIFEHV